MRGKYADDSVAALEPGFGATAELLGLKVHNQRFAPAMKNAELSSADVVDFESDLKSGQGQNGALQGPGQRPGSSTPFANRQTRENPCRRRLRSQARKHDVSAGIIDRLDAIDRALASSAF